MLVDVAHVSRAGMLQAAEVSRTPIVSTHSCIRALCDHPRNMDDAQLDALRDVGGVIQITAVPSFLKKEAKADQVTTADFADHVDYAVRRIGIEHVGISSDFDGGGGFSGWMNAADSPNITAELHRRGYDRAALAALWGGNFLRVLRHCGGGRGMTRTVRLPDGTEVPALGQGTWHMGESARLAKQEVAALKLGIELGVTLIDTAEMYGNGARRGAGRRGDRRPARRVVHRQQGVSAQRVALRHAGGVRAQPATAAGRLHRPVSAALARVSHPLSETVEAFEKLKAAGKIRYWGVSNFDTGEMERVCEAAGWRRVCDRPGAVPPGHARHRVRPAAVVRRSIACRSWRIRRWGRAGGCCGRRRWPRWRSGMARRRRRSRLPGACGAARRSRSPRRPIPAHVRENAVAGDIALTAEDLAEIDARHPPPRKKQGLDIL